VQFRALVTPCMPVCEPVICVTEDEGSIKSYGRRRRRRSSDVASSPSDLLLVESIHISDTFQFDRQTANKTLTEGAINKSDLLLLGGMCNNMAGYVVAGAVFIVLQMLLLISWAVVRSRRGSGKSIDTHSSTDSLGKLYDSGYARRF
jgi:hypothetical protein